jgi:uncharacterized protein YwlG (UPF0340 family)
MACAAGFDTDQTGFELLKKPVHLRTAQCLADNDFAGTIDGMDLEHVLRQIKTDCANFHIEWLPWLVVA